VVHRYTMSKQSGDARQAMEGDAAEVYRYTMIKRSGRRVRPRQGHA
jgi:hypothetical protein